ncbi:hypothetical protein KSS87_014907, partial [Heliosperma pusillum]
RTTLCPIIKTDQAHRKLKALLNLSPSPLATIHHTAISSYFTYGHLRPCPNDSTLTPADRNLMTTVASIFGPDTPLLLLSTSPIPSIPLRFAPAMLLPFNAASHPGACRRRFIAIWFFVWFHRRRRIVVVVDAV